MGIVEIQSFRHHTHFREVLSTLDNNQRCNLPDEAGCTECSRLRIYGTNGSLGLEPWVLNLEGLYIFLGTYTRHLFHGKIHHTTLLVGLQNCCTESLVSSYIIAIIVDTR